MNLFTVFGNPISHSFSPKIHNYAFLKLGLHKNAYTKTLIQNALDLKAKFTSLALSGANVTVPFKEDAFLLCDQTKGIATKIGAVNSIVLENSDLIGYNTDAQGFLNALNSKGSFKKALILGAGGSARAVACILQEHLFDVRVANRSPKRLEFFKALGLKTSLSHELDDFAFDVIINTTSAGLKDELLPINADILQKLATNKPFFFDLIYGKTTPFLQFAKTNNLHFSDGGDMLVWQGAIAFCLFTGFDDLNKVKELMQTAFRF